MILSNTFNQEEHNQTIMECLLHIWRHSDDPMFITAIEDDGEFSIYDSNPASREALGLSQKENLHRNKMRELFPGPIVDSIYATYREALNNQSPTYIEQSFIKDGVTCYFNTLLVPIFDENSNPIFICGISRETTKIKEAEVLAIEAKELAIDAKEKQQEYSSALEEINSRLDEKVRQRTAELEQAKIALEEALEAKTSFVSRMSHEIRTPINAVIGLSYLALKTPLDDEQQDYLTKIQSSGDTLLGLVNDVLDFSKIEAGKLELESAPFSLEATIRTAVDLSTINALKQNIELVIDISSELPSVVLGDSLRFQQILMNLLSNAVKFTSDGLIIVQLTGELNSNGLLLTCAVSDTGVGIAEDKKDLLFSSFTQADNTITRQYGGTGLGLTITKQLCELMGGGIEVESSIGQGTTFTVQIPLELPASQPQESAFNNPSSGQMSALIIDSQKLSRELLSEFLHSFNVASTNVNNVSEAIATIQENVINNVMYDMIFIDSQMPDIDGVKKAQILQQSFKGLSLPAAILMGSTHEKSHVKPYLANGFIDQFIEKPISRSVLLDSLNKYFQLQSEAHKGAIDTSVPNLTGFKILLVEDNAINMQVALGYLTNTSANIATADNGLEALEYLQNQDDIDLVLMDIQMPKMDGLTATAKIRLIETYRDTPIIAMTAHTSQEDKNESLAAGMNDHIDKPILRKQLFKKITQQLHGLTPKNSQEPKPEEQDSSTNKSDCDTFEELLTINGIEAKKALANLHDNRALYLDITKMFWQKYNNIAELNTAKAYFLDNHLDLSDAIHTLKSNAAYIGAYDLQSLCSEIEKTLQDRQLPLNDLLEAIPVELSRILCQLSKIFDTQDNKDKSQNESLESTLKNILPLLEKSNLAVESYLMTLEDFSKNSPYKESIMSIIKKVKKLEFECAEKEVRQLIKDLEKS